VSGSSFLSFLGPNTTPIVRELGQRLSAELGIDLAGDLAPSWADFMAAIDGGTAPVVWLCGLATTELIDSGRFDAEIVAAPVFPGEPGPVYRSFVVARREAGVSTLDDLAGSRLAINSTGSWSGYHALRVHLAEAGRFEAFFATATETGSHDASIDAVLAGGADCAAIDSTVWDDRVSRDPRTRDLRVVARTRDHPVPPFSLSRTIDADLRRAIAAGLVRSAPVGLDAIVPASDADYDPLRSAMAVAGRVAW
jgi:ABC-type phosphate/phosphonate transport system substrate-binding protein